LGAETTAPRSNRALLVGFMLRRLETSIPRSSTAGTFPSSSAPPSHNNQWPQGCLSSSCERNPTFFSHSSVIGEDIAILSFVRCLVQRPNASRQPNGFPSRSVEMRTTLSARSAQP
jgi:hypothetical protein